MIGQFSNAELEKKYTSHNFHQICMNRIGEEETANLGYLVSDYIFHLKHHLKQIVEIA